MVLHERSTDDTIKMIPFYIAITLVPLGVIVAVGLMLYAGPASIRRLREDNQRVRSRVEDINLDTMNSRPPRPQRISIAPWMIDDEDMAPLSLSRQYRAIPPIPNSNRPISLPQPAMTPPGQQRRDIAVCWQSASPSPVRTGGQRFVRFEGMPTGGPRGRNSNPFKDPIERKHQEETQPATEHSDPAKNGEGSELDSGYPACTTAVTLTERANHRASFARRLPSSEL